MVIDRWDVQTGILPSTAANTSRDVSAEDKSSPTPSSSPSGEDSARHKNCTDTAYINVTQPIVCALSYVLHQL